MEYGCAGATERIPSAFEPDEQPHRRCTVRRVVINASRLYQRRTRAVKAACDFIAGRACGRREKQEVVKEDYKTAHPWQKRPTHDRTIGLVMVNTGPGKGKTTSALGLALRAIGHGHRVKMIQFMKGDPNFGELLVRERLPELEIEQYGLDRFVDPKDPEPEQVARAHAGYEAARGAVMSGDYNVVILDEANVAMAFGLIPTAGIVELLRDKPAHVEVILTGRDAPQAIIEAADYVNLITDVKHPYAKNVPARVGIEF
jgi:cob(I)alamin adenosyltransferase